MFARAAVDDANSTQYGRCLLELWEAQRAGVPIVVLVVTGRGFSAEDARALIEGIDVELPARNPGGASGESNLGHCELQL